MQEPIVLKELEDLILELGDFRSSGKLTLPELELINNAIIVCSQYRELRKFGITDIHTS